MYVCRYLPTYIEVNKIPIGEYLFDLWSIIFAIHTQHTTKDLQSAIKVAAVAVLLDAHNVAAAIETLTITREKLDDCIVFVQTYMRQFNTFVAVVEPLMHAHDPAQNPGNFIGTMSLLAQYSSNSLMQQLFVEGKLRLPA